VEGLICEVDLDAREVLEVIDHGVVPLPPAPGNYEEPWLFESGNVPEVERFREDLKPIEITQPEGPSFTVDGHAVSWQKWQVRIGFTPREGLVLHQVSYAGRSIVHRASLVEMYVPYGDPAPTHRFKNVFDQGEYGVGWLANSLVLGCDCVGHIHYFDGVVNDNDGGQVVIPNAICMHEEDAGIGWKHMDFRTEATQVRRRRRLVISSVATVGNYEYGYFWYLYTDGTIEYEIKLTGVISTGAIAEGETPRHGTLVAPGLYGPHHQHFFCVRLDMAVDGAKNTVVEIDSVPSAPVETTPVSLTSYSIVPSV
jgi:primary-amine oxidase